MSGGTVSPAAGTAYDVGMIAALPRPLIWIGVPALVFAVGAALWAWARFGFGVWFDTVADGLALCL